MNSLKEIWAKSSPVETLEEHTTNVLKIWSELRTRYKKVIDDENFWSDSFYALAFHDFGKICSNFQETIKGKRAYNDDERVRHEFFSGMFLFSNNHRHYEKNPESLVAVFSHHKPFNDDGFNKHIRRNRVIRYTIEKHLVDEFIELANKKATEYQIHEIPIDEKLKYFVIENYSRLIKWYLRKIYDLISQYGHLSESNRITYIKHKAILNIADWTASSGGNLELGIRFNLTDLQAQIISKLEQEGKNEIAKEFRFREFQHAGIAHENVIALAPTGSGKTEAALLWASSKDKLDRIIYLLPTRVTSNAIFTRLIKYFGYDHVQLVHSSARLFIKEQVDNDYDQKKYFRDKSFFKNINVCTVDQVLTQGFNLGFWEVKTFHMLNARVIIDEIHLYSPYTLGLIISTIKYLKEHFNTQFFIMSATMPKKLLNLLETTLGNVSLVKDKELLEEARNTFEVRDSDMSSLLEEINEALLLGKKVLIVVNTVDNAIKLYSQIKPTAIEAGIEAICYHSRFINEDRSKKENEIFTMERKNKGGILVATQVVEVSLDIDFDILFTENAPIDAIIQRAGRVNRKREKKDTRVIIAKHFEITKKIYDVRDILEDTFSEFLKRNKKKLTENDLTEMINIVYSNMDIKSNSDFQEGVRKHSEIQFKYNFIKDLTSDEKVFTRENLDTISVIPDCFYEKLFETKNKDEYAKHELNVRRNWKSRATGKEHNGFWFLAGEYSYETGFKLKRQSIVSI